VDEKVTGLENLALRYQGEYDVTCHVRGYKYDTSTGGANPTDATLAAGANWDLAASSVKHGGVFSVAVATS
jgi:hypothetical protein